MKLLEQTFLFQFDFGVKFVCHYFNIERCSAHTVWEIPLLQCGKVLWKSQCWITADISMHCQRWQTFALRVLPILVCGEQFISILIYLVTVMYYVNNSSTSWLQIIVVVWLHIECRGNNSATSKLVHPVDGWAVTFGRARSGDGWITADRGPFSLYQCNSLPINGQCTNRCIVV